jgi:hypothetical protein
MLRPARHCGLRLLAARSLRIFLRIRAGSRNREGVQRATEHLCCNRKRTAIQSLARTPCHALGRLADTYIGCIPQQGAAN